MMYSKNINTCYAVREARLISLLRELERKDPELAKNLAENMSTQTELILKKKEAESA